MVDLQYIKELLTLLKASNVASYKAGDLELLFHIEQRPSTDAVQDLPTLDFQLPVDLRTDGAAGYDNLLFHSASPSNHEEPLPGLGEEPL